MPTRYVVGCCRLSVWNIWLIELFRLLGWWKVAAVKLGVKCKKLSVRGTKREKTRDQTRRDAELWD